jgi:hypothetical protein
LLDAVALPRLHELTTVVELVLEQQLRACARRTPDGSFSVSDAKSGAAPMRLVIGNNAKNVAIARPD